MRFVDMKTEAQLDMQTLHRSRERLVGERTALINQLRAVLLERGIVVPQGRRKFEQYLVAMMDEHDGEGLSATAPDAAMLMRTGTRVSPSWPGPDPRPDTLKQTAHGHSKETTCNGAGHTFFYASSPCEERVLKIL